MLLPLLQPVTAAVWPQTVAGPDPVTAASIPAARQPVDRPPAHAIVAGPAVPFHSVYAAIPSAALSPADGF